MKRPPAIDAMVVRFDRMTLRERLLIFAAVLAVVVVGWQSLFMEKLDQDEKRLSLELNELQESVAQIGRATEAVAGSDPTTIAMARLREQKQALAAINAKLATESAGLIAPDQMVAVIHDVLRHQQGLTLVSLRNLPVTSLAPPIAEKKASDTSEGQATDSSVQRADEEGVSGDAGGEDASSMPAGSVATGSGQNPGLPPAADESAGPYLHPVELVVEGRYLDIVAYLHSLEGLQWHFYWRVLELETKTYPLNRVRIELSTVSLDKEWIGV